MKTAGMPSLRIVFFGTAELARTSLAALHQNPAFAIAAVVTQPDRPKGRDLKLQPPPVKIEATERNLPVLQPERARNESFITQLRELAPDLIVVAAYGQILPAAILELPRFGCLNVHTSLLPKYRGAAPIQWAILNGEAETGVTIMKMDAGLDTGDILTQEAIPILPRDNSQTLHDRLAILGASLLVRTIPEYIAGAIQPRKQPDTGVTYASKIAKEHGRLDWKQPARSLWNQVRAFTPWPGAFTTFREGSQPRILKVWETEMSGDNPAEPGTVLQADKSGILVSCGEQSLRITVLQREGGRRLNAGEFLSGFPLQPGARFE
jgi:methionyl-tRNA formyltransferase